MSTADLTSSTFATPVTVVKQASERTYATTEAQLEIWLASQQGDELNCAYNEISSLDLQGTLDINVLRSSVAAVIDRHASLRSTFSVDGRRVIVHDQMELDYEVVDWTHKDPESTSTERARLLKREGTRPFDLVNGPLIRFVLQKLGDQHHRLTFNAHHIIMDGWSLGLFCRDLGSIYDQMLERQSQSLPQPDQYEAYAAATRTYRESEQYANDIDFWRDQFSDGVPVLNTPIEFPRPSLKTYRSERYDCFISGHLADNLRRLGSSNGCSLFNTMLAAFSAYISRLTKMSDFCVGVPTAGQSAMNLPELVGFCVNTMPVRLSVDSTHGFSDLLRSIRSTVLDAFDHQRLSLGTLIRQLAPARDPSRSPIIDLSFNLDPETDLSEGGFADLLATVTVEPRCFEKFEWFINGVIHRGGSLELQTQFNADLYSEDAMDTYFQGFIAFLEQIVEDPDKPICDHHLMSIEQRQRVIVDWNRTDIDYPIEATLHQEFSRQASDTPGNIAVEFQGVKLTYEEVDTASNQLAHYLVSAGVEPGDLVGICVERSEKMLVALLAILKTGAGYVPLDPAYPVDRLQYMCDHSGLDLVLTQSDLRDFVADFGKRTIEIDTVAGEVARQSTGKVTVETRPKDICYVIYTSGSTGKPKGVQVPHGAVVNFLYSMKREPGFREEDSVLAVTTLSFDIAVLELYLPLICGGRVVIADGQTASDGDALARCLDRHDISILQATPATWRLLLQGSWRGKPDLKALCGGEPLPREIVSPLLERCGELWNMYGPTETTVWSTVYQVRDAEDLILIGRPIGNTQVYILDERGREVPIGCEGELHIGGAGVTLGYRDRPEQTSERFIRNPYRNPFKHYVSDRLYRTGDIARIRMDGNLEFVRRNDKQVKVRGFRIELGEIEQNLKNHPAIQQSVVVVREDTPGDARLVAYWVPNEGSEPSSGEFREHLRRSLPGYMIPQHFVCLDAMPLTNNGKIDFKQFPAPGDDSDASFAHERELTVAQGYLVGLCRALLEHDEVSLDETFFDLGGHSLLVMQLIAKIDDQFGCKLAPRDFLVMTLRQLALQLETTGAFGEESPLKPAKPEDASEMERPESVSGEEVVESDEVTDDVSAQRRESYLEKLRGFWG